MLFRIEAPNIDTYGNITYVKAGQSANDLYAVKRARQLGGRVLAIDGANNRLIDDFWSGSQVETEYESRLKAEKKTYKEWKADHNTAQVFH